MDMKQPPGYRFTLARWLKCIYICCNSPSLNVAKPLRLFVSSSYWGHNVEWVGWLCRLTFRRGTYDEKGFERELYEEQMSLLSHMEIPPGIAKNQALRENVFVTLTCILQKIPLFVVGKPGSGKTLSLQLIFR